MTLEKIKKLADQVPEEYDLRLGEIQDIYRAAKKDSFWMICYAFAYGFHRGQESKENAPA